MPTESRSTDVSRKSALKFIVMLGFVSLFADVTYEGARSVIGPYFAILGASATVVGVFSGLGEFIGYALRLVSGYFSDKTGKYWALTITGYAVNLLAVPLLALAGRWEVAAALIIMERMGKAIRSPARDAILSHATKQVGQGWGFGIHEAMDQVGALTGPLIIAAVLYFKGGYKTGFITLAIPALLAITVLVIARITYPSPRDFDPIGKKLEGKGLPRVFWIYLLAIGLIAAGYADYPLIAFHLKKNIIVSDNWIPVFYAIAMAVDAISALVCGKFFDRIGMSVLIFVVLISAFFAPLVFLGGFGLALLGMAVWGIGMGAQESIMRAAVATMVASNKRGSAYGIFNTGYGLFWFLGSALMGILYDRHVFFLVAFSVVVQLASIPVLLIARKKLKTLNFIDI
ncbi:MAG: MFS transporter [Candidatus Omnitrophica bacterium]|jgi:MFS family permease|nr:MFS transporter [Candidatus Omnitrophota bacterium]